MKKGYILLAILVMTIAALPASAQQLRLGIEAGATINKSTWELPDGYKKKSVGGYVIGLTAEYEIYDNVWFQSGFLFNTKGAESMILKQPTPGHENYLRDIRKTYRPMYLQIPLTIAYRFKVGERFGIFAAAGGYVSQGLTGEYSEKLIYDRATTPGTWNDESKSESAFSKGGLKRFDAGLTLGGGIEFGRLTLRVSHDWGMLNIAKDKDILGTDNFKNRSLSIAAGFKFKF